MRAGSWMAGLALAWVLAGCGDTAPGGSAVDDAGASGTPAATAPPPTAVARVVRTATPTPVDPTRPVGSTAIPGVVVPAGAVLVEALEATDDTDARADYRVEGIPAEDLPEWFSEHMQAAGWGEPEASDGALVFLHATELSRRHAEVGQKRTATVVFGLDEDSDVTLLVEEPER